MGSKQGKPWSFGVSSSKKGTKSIVAFIIVLVFAILAQAGGALYNELRDRRERPVIALKSFLRDLRDFVRIEKKMPQDLREIEVKVWDKNNPGAPSRLSHGNHLLLADNYEYIYLTGNVGGETQANVWALPLGKYRDDYETVLMVVTLSGEAVWHGPALSNEQREFVLNHGFNLSLPQMSQLNMKRDFSEAQPQPKKGLF